MTEERRTVRVDSYFSPTEYKMFHEKMQKAGVSNMSAFIRKMSLDGFIIKLNMKETKEMTRLLRIYGNNLNQIARRVNETNRFYAADLEEIRAGQDKLWVQMNKVLRALARLE